MGKHARPKAQDSDRLINLRKQLRALTESYKRKEIDEASYKGLAKSFNDDIKYEEKRG